MINDVSPIVHLGGNPAGTITYNLRPDGQPSSIVAPGSITTSFEYDDCGRQTKLVDPSAGTRTFVYDAAGNLNSQTDALGKVTNTTYDAYNRVIQKEITGELTTTYSYNTDGQLATVSNNNSSGQSYTYDGLMRVATATETAPDGKWLQKNYTYANGTPTAISYTSQNGAIATENYLYSNGNLAEIKLNGSASLWKLTTENDMRMATGATTGNLTRTYGYDAYVCPRRGRSNMAPQLCRISIITSTPLRATLTGAKTTHGAYRKVSHTTTLTV